MSEPRAADQLVTDFATALAETEDLVAAREIVVRFELAVHRRAVRRCVNRLLQLGAVHEAGQLQPLEREAPPA